MPGPRYAIYYAPAPASSLWRFGSAVLGYDAATGADTTLAPPPGYDPESWRRLTEEPRRYGFHATLKAPFHLRASRTVAELSKALAHFSRGRAAAVLGRLEVSAIGPFLALTAPAASRDLPALAQSVVVAFEAYRAPLEEADRERRLAAGLTDRQRDQLERYGYPYVGEDFQFHMTLTGPTAPDERDGIRKALQVRYGEAVGAQPWMLDRLALYEQPSRDSRFRIIASAQLG